MKSTVLNTREKHDSPADRIDPTVKIIAFFYIIITLYLVKDIYGNLIILSLILIVTRIAALPLRRLFKGVYLFVAVALLTHLFFTPGKPLLSLNPAFISLTEEGFREGVFTSLRLTNMILMASVLTLTTSPERLIEGLARLLSPVERVGIPVQKLSVMIALSLRFIPTLIEEVSQALDSGLNHAFRNNKGENMRFSRRIKDITPILSDIFVRMFSMADEIIATGDLPPQIEKKSLGIRDKLAITGISAIFIIGWVLLI